MSIVGMWSGAFAAAGLLLLSGCGITDVCTDEAVPAIRVAVVDSVSGAAIANPLVWVGDGMFQDTLEVFPNGIAHGVYERAGTYEVHVEHDDYESWVRTGVTVTEGKCHVNTRELTARLQSP
jgi:major membrane immunogen (membrane-anchored lipoprotein)